MVSGQIKLTDDQRKAFDIIMRGDNTFVTGGAGTGKSILIKTVIRELEMQHKNVVVCAPTGIAAVNIRGITIHKAFGFPKGPCITEKTCKLSIRTPKLIRAADVIVVDEISMCRMDMMDAICASILKVQEETGRHVQLVVAGDFCQLPPVIVDGTGERELLQDFYGTPIGLGFAFQAPGWRKMAFTNVELNDIIRQQDEDFIHFLNLLRYGDASALRYFNALASFDDDTNATKLTARNDDVDRLNDRELARIQGEIVTFQPHCYGLQTDMLYGNLSVSLKVGAKVIVTTNQALPISGGYGNSRGVHNGTLGIVTAAGSYPESPENDYVVVSTGGRAYCINRKTEDVYSHSVDHDGRIRREIKGRISYMPVKPGYVMTIHRSQGQTFDSIVLDPTCWSSGQLYVAISRLRSIDGLHLTRKIKAADIQLAPIVKEFYTHLNDHDYVPSWERPLVNTTEKKVPDGCNGNIFRFPVGKTLQPQPVISEPESSVLHEPDIFTTLPKKLAGADPDIEVKSSAISAPLLQAIDSSVVTRYNEGSANALPEDQADAEKHPVIKPEEPDAADVASNTKESALKNKKVDSTADTVKKTRGRPVRYSNNSKVCRIPVELVDEVKLMLKIVCPKGGINIRELQRFKQGIRNLCEEQE